MRSIRSFFSALIVLVAGIALIVISAVEMTDYSRKAEDFSQLTISDIKEGMMIEGDLPYNYGSYEYIKKDKEKEGFGYYYLIDVNTTGFMGLYTNIDELIAKLDRQSEITNRIESFDQIDKVPSVHFKGKVTRMDDEDSQYYMDAISGDMELDSEYIEEYCPKLYIKCIDTSSHPFMLVIGSVCTLAGVVLMFLFVRRKLIGR